MMSASEEDTPRWVKVFAAALGLLVVLVLVGLMFGVDHRPGQHALSALPYLTR